MDAGEQLNRRPPTGAVAIVLYCAFRSDHLIAAWQYSPFDRWSWIALLLWLLPVAFVWRLRPDRFRLGRVNHALLVLALLISLVGTMASMNAVKYAGLAVAVVSLVRWSAAHFCWLPGAVAWMPGFGYLAAKVVPFDPPVSYGVVLAARLALAAATVFCVWKLSPMLKTRPA